MLFLKKRDVSREAIATLHHYQYVGRSIPGEEKKEGVVLYTIRFIEGGVILIEGGSFKRRD